SNMSRTNPHATIISEEHLVPSANRLVIKKNDQRVASDLNITDTMLRFVVRILRHHKLCLNLILVNPIPNLPQKTKSSDLSRHGYDEDPKGKMTYVSKFVATRLRQLWRTILSVLNRSLTGKDTSWDTARLPILHILWGIIHSANLDFASLI
ncbi:hypothetical protein Tco_0123814, partial [Tanacetum coccineum]